MYTEQQKRDFIREIQTYLHYISRLEGSIPVVIPDGIYGNETRAAVTDFQKLYGIKPTGEVDQGTWDRVVIVYRDLAEIPRPVYFLPTRNYVIGKGDTGSLVYMVQLMLKELGDFYGNISSPRVSGVYDTDTENAVKDWQKSARLKQTGSTDMDTWNILADAFSRLNSSR
ncbi:MAG: peptidoglycan-binding protein [Ruminiclostridium sp.]